MREEIEHRRAEAEALLRRHWGYAGFRPGQWEAVAAVLEGEDALTVLPTGGGKSLCYQLPALMQEGLTLVISPLIALMQDQVAGLQARGIPAAFINSTLRPAEVEQRWTDAEFGRYRLLYIAPERLQTERFQARAARLGVTLLAVDEAHCVSEWGHHFRPAYRRIAEARQALGDPPMLAVTATATPQVRQDIVEGLGLRSPRVLVRGFDRPNVVWSIFRTDNKHAKLLDVVQGVPGSGIVYTATRWGAEAWADRLAQAGIAAAAYHGGLPAPDRKAIQEAWLSGACRVVAATNAFGMGIDKPDVRFVVHVDLPASLEAYYQEAGRAGRDGERAYAVLLVQEQDVHTQEVLIEESHPSAADVRRVYDTVCSLAQIAIGSLPDGPVQVDLDLVGQVTGFGPSKVRMAIELLARQGVWQRVPARRHHGYIRFLQSADALRRYRASLENRALADFIDRLLRTVHADAFAQWWEIDLRLLERRTGLPRDRLQRGLAYLQERHLLQWRPPGQAEQLLFAAPRSQRVPVDDLAVRRARRQAEARLQDMVRYARSVTCRRQFLLAYFGEAAPARCGACDLCLGRHRPVVITTADEPVLRQVLQHVADGLSREAWSFPEAGSAAERLDGLVDWLVQEGYLIPRSPLAGTFDLTDKARGFLAQWTPRPEQG
ncbi:helicase [Rhodothermaceae bacterium RA]|nr:helicase [Rhodothermaceae bacterium RA]